MPDLDDFFAFKNSGSDNNGGGNPDISKWILVLLIVALLAIFRKCSG